MSACALGAVCQITNMFLAYCQTFDTEWKIQDDWLGLLSQSAGFLKYLETETLVSL